MGAARGEASGGRGALALATGLLAGVNLLNNRLAPGAYVPTSMLAAGALLGLARRAGCSWEDLGLGRRDAGRGLRWAGAAAAVVAGGYLAALLAPGGQALLADRRVAGLSAGGLLARALVRVPLGTVLLEEVAFRGVLHALARRVAGRPAADLASAALFGLWHVLPASDAAGKSPLLPEAGALAVAGAVAATGVGGLALGALRERSGSLLAPAGAHLATNALGYLAAYRAMAGRVSGQEAAPELRRRRRRPVPRPPRASGRPAARP